MSEWTKAPDGTYVGGSEWTKAPDGTYVGGRLGPWRQTAPTLVAPNGHKPQMELTWVVVIG